jgi:hypothetical protein
LVTVENITPIFAFAATDVGVAAPYYNIETTNTTAVPSQDPSFQYSWDVKQVAIGNAGSVTPSTEVNASCWQITLPLATFWFPGYQAGTTYSNPTGPFSCSNPTAGLFKRGDEYLLTYATWSNICPAKSYTVTAYICSSGCRLENDGSVLPNLTDAEILNIHNQEIQSLTDIYPNPSNGNFTIETAETETQLVQVFDMTGRLVLSQNLDGKATVNAAELVDGIYNVKITGSNTNVNKRMVIAK